MDVHYFQTVVLLNEENSPSVAETLECIAASDVLVASESTLSRAAVVLSKHVKVRICLLGLARLLASTCFLLDVFSFVGIFLFAVLGVTSADEVDRGESRTAPGD